MHVVVVFCLFVCLLLLLFCLLFFFLHELCMEIRQVSNFIAKNLLQVKIIFIL